MKTLELDDLSGLRPFTAQSPFIDMGPAALYLYRNEISLTYEIYADSLCMYAHYDGRDYGLFPPGGDVAGAVSHMMSRMDKPSFDFVPEEGLSVFKKLGLDAACTYDPMYSDYVCRADDFLALSWKACKNKYAEYRAFTSKNAFATRLLTGRNAGECRAILDRWCDGRDCSLCAYTCEKDILDEAAANFDALGLRGLIVDVEGEPAAYIITEQNGDSANILFAKQPKRINGLGVFSYMEAVRTLHPGVSRVNMSPDSGMEGLKIFKSKFRPFSLVHKRFVTVDP